MAILDRLLRRGEQRDQPLQAVMQAVADGEFEVASGVTITPETALRQTAVYAAVRVLAESVGSLPFPVYRREGRSRLPAHTDRRWPLLNDQPNPEQTAMELWENVVGHLNLWGNAYLFKVVDGAGAVRELWPLLPNLTRPERSRTGQLSYKTFLQNGQEVTLHPQELLHFRSFSTQRGYGLSPIGLARQALGIAVAAEEYGARFFANDARPGGIIQHKDELTVEGHADLLKKWKAGHQTLKRRHLVAILDRGAEWKNVGLPPGDAQFLETRSFSVREVARLFRVPPHMIGDLEGTVTYASIEQQSLDFVVHSLRPWLVRIESKVKTGIFDPDDPRDRNLYPQFKVDGLLRGDIKTRYEAYAIGRSWGWLSANDVRELEDEEMLGDVGDVYLQPANYVPAGTDTDGLRGILAPVRLDHERDRVDNLVKRARRNGARGADVETR